MNLSSLEWSVLYVALSSFYSRLPSVTISGQVIFIDTQSEFPNKLVVGR